MKPHGPAVLTRLGGGQRTPGSLQRTTGITLAMLFVLSHPLWAATIVVDETTCTLVDAITAANTDAAVGGCVAGSGADNVQLTTNVTLTTVDNHGGSSYLGDNGLPVVESDIMIEGTGFIIERNAGAPWFRLFAVETSGTLTLDNVTLQNGRTSYGGAIRNKGTLTLINSTVSDNRSFASGGGIRNVDGSVTLTNSTVSGNHGGTYYGGGIVSKGVGSLLTLTNSTVSGNDAVSGGGIVNFGGTATLTNSTVSGNSGPMGGGGIVNGGGSLPASITLTNSTVSGNSTANVGGGILNGGTATLTNTTVSGNTNTSTGFAGGIRNSGSATLTNSTVSGNTGGISTSNYSTGTVTLTNSIIANSLFGSNCDGDFITDNGNNFADDDTCGPGFADITPDVDFDTTLADNGGPTQTHALFPGSVTIDAAGDCGLDTDQRGFPRDDGACDSGAFEYGATPEDADQDGVLDDVDICLETAIPESVPTNHLGINRWALVDEDSVFDTNQPPGGGNGPDFEFTVEDTRGCSCEQIIEAWALGWGHTKFGCSTGVMLQWVADVWNYEMAQPETESQANSGGLQTLDGGVGDPFAAGTHGTSDSGAQRPAMRPRRQVPRRDARED